MRSQAEWDLHFMGIAEKCAEMSKDPSTKTGAVLVLPGRIIAGTGYNGFARGMSDAEELYEDREVKYDRIIHCEMNAVLQAVGAGRDLQDATLYTYPFLSCSRCAVHMIQAGIRSFVTFPTKAEANSRWSASFERTKSYIKEVKKADFRIIDPKTGRVLETQWGRAVIDQ